MQEKQLCLLEVSPLVRSYDTDQKCFSVFTGPFS